MKEELTVLQSFANWLAENTEARQEKLQVTKSETAFVVTIIE